MEGPHADPEPGDTDRRPLPVSMDLSPATGFLFLLNFNVLWHHVRSSVSVIDTVSMTEIAEIEPGAIPYRSRLSRDGMLVHSVAMLSGAPTCRNDFMGPAGACFRIASWTGRSRTPGPAPGSWREGAEAVNRSTGNSPTLSWRPPPSDGN